MSELGYLCNLTGLQVRLMFPGGTKTIEEHQTIEGSVRLDKRNAILFLATTCTISLLVTVLLLSLHCTLVFFSWIDRWMDFT